MKTFLKRVWSWLKPKLKFVLVVLGAAILIFTLKRRQKDQIKDLEQLKKDQQELEEKLKNLKREAEKHEKTRYFDNSDNAVKYLNDVLRRIQNNSKDK